MTLKIFKSEQVQHERISSKGKAFLAGHGIKHPTCQICGRPIQANMGVIAHHGYQRPGGGWQSASCSGARGLPYEISCDLIPPTIKRIEQYIDTRKAQLKKINDTPPESYTVQIRIDAYTKEPRVLPRPTGFDPNNRNFVNISYEREYHKQIFELESDIKSSKRFVDYLKKRLESWTPPKKLASGEIEVTVHSEPLDPPKVKRIPKTKEQKKEEKRLEKIAYKRQRDAEQEHNMQQNRLRYELDQIIADNPEAHAKGELYKNNPKFKDLLDRLSATKFPSFLAILEEVKKENKL